MAEPLEAPQEAIRNLHGCEAMWLESVPVKEVVRGQTVWEGVVHMDSLEKAVRDAIVQEQRER